MSAPVAEALDVIGRTAAWLGRDGGRNVERARFIEGTLWPWAARVVEGAPDELAPEAQAVAEAVAGFDSADASERRSRVGRLVEALARLRVLGEAAATTAPPTAGPRAVLSPADIGTAVPPRVLVPVPAAPVVEAVVNEPRARDDARPAAPDRDGGRRGRRRHGRDTETTSDRPGVPSEDPHRPPAAEPRPAPPVEPAPPEPPPSFPLAYPEASGRPVAVLGATPAEVDALLAAGVESVADLLGTPPVGHDRAGERLVDGVPPEGPILVRGQLARRFTRFFPAGRRFEAVLVHERGELPCRWLGAVPDEVRAARPGGNFGLAGRAEADENGLVLYEGEPLGVDGRGGDFWPRYGIPGLPELRARALVRAALRSVDGQLLDHLPPEVLERHKLAALGVTLRDVHFPSNVNRRPRQRMAFDELLQIQLGIALLRSPEKKDRATPVPISHDLLTRALSQAGWLLHDGQEVAFDAIRRDLRRNVPMERLLQGDANSGKGALVRAAMTVVADAKAQVLFCAADARSAEHHHCFAVEWFRSVGIEPVLLVGAPTKAQAEALRKGETLVVYGTHALVENPPECKRVGLVVVEQNAHYSVPNLSHFGKESGRPHLLVTTPTPVPALLAMTVFGQLAMSVVSAPAGHGVDSHVLRPGARDEAYAAARAALSAGQQVMVVFPFGPRGQDLLSPSEARRMAEVLAGEALAGAKIGLFSGGLTAQERFRAYDDFQHRRTDVLLATTAFEEGPVVPNASVVIAEYADRFDLVRLHRLRNHVANGWVRGACYFVQSDEVHAEGAAALELVARETDGFRVADIDISLRGAEAVLGPEAAEVPRFAWAEPAQDRETLVRARAEAFKLLALDPGLRRRGHRPLANLVRSRFGEEMAASDALAGPAPAEAASAGAGGNGRKRRRRRR